MPRSTRQPVGSCLLYLYEALLSLNVSFAGVSFVELLAHDVLSPFFQIEFSINRFLHIRQTDLVRGYFAFCISSTLVAICLWGLLRLSSRSALMVEIHRFAVPFVVLLLPSAFWLYVNERFGWPYGFPYHGAPFELLAALACTSLFL